MFANLGDFAHSTRQEAWSHSWGLSLSLACSSNYCLFVQIRHYWLHFRYCWLWPVYSQGSVGSSRQAPWFDWPILIFKSTDPHLRRCAAPAESAYFAINRCLERFAEFIQIETRTSEVYSVFLKSYPTGFSKEESIQNYYSPQLQPPRAGPCSAATDGGPNCDCSHADSGSSRRCARCYCFFAVKCFPVSCGAARCYSGSYFDWSGSLASPRGVDDPLAKNLGQRICRCLPGFHFGRCCRTCSLHFGFSARRVEDAHCQ